MKSGGLKTLAVAALVAVAAIFMQPAWAAQELVPLVTPPAGGTAYVLGAGITNVSNKFMPE